MAIIILIIVLFIYSEGGSFYWWSINTEMWSRFGSFMGAFLLSITILYQIQAFRRQQIEAKFFELIKYYRDNVSEMRFKNPFFYKDNRNEFGDEYVEGRRFFKILFDQYKLAFRFINETYVCKENIFNTGPKDKMEWDAYKKTPEFKKEKIAIAYLLIYWGVAKDSEKDLKNSLSKTITNENANRIYQDFRRIYAVYEINEFHVSNYFKLLNEQDSVDVLYSKERKGSTKFFGGHQYHLGHYFRHLYQAINYIHKQPWWVLSNSAKYDYVKTLRAQMSNYEQAIFFLNSVTHLGSKWETKNRKLITKYNLVKNLPKNFIESIEVDCYYPKVDYEWNN
ncbi:MAG: putative phage abortive infection protein [Bacteroidales bacterium]|nr:putative phage abortive infection protein [Bacteroidales bacterium]